MKQAPVVMITGASAGIGRATAEAFGHSGARIGLIARGRERLEATRDAVKAAGGDALVLPVDVADAEGVEQAAIDLEAQFGPLDIWVNSAMATVFSPLARMTPDEFRRVTDTTYHGTVYGTMAALKRMLPRDRGTIVQVGSALAYRGIPLQSAYCGAKHAIRGFTDSLRSELLHERSRVKLTMVQLGAFNTPQFDWNRNHMPRRPQPLPPMFQPEVAAKAIMWAASHPRREVSVGLASVLTQLGQKVLPGFMDRYMARNAWDGQMADESAVPFRKDNLFEPVAGNYGSHGRFDDQAKNASVQALLSRHRGLVTGLGGTAALLGATLIASTLANNGALRRRPVPERLTSD